MTAIRAIIGLVFALAGPATAAPVPGARPFAPVEALLNTTQDALSRREDGLALAGARALVASAPHHWGFEILLARALARSGAPQSSLAAYGRLVQQGFGGVVAGDADFLTLRSQSGWRRLHAIAARQARVSDPARLAFRLQDARAIPEGLAYDKRSRRFFVSSTYLRAVIARAPSGRFDDFTPPEDHGMLQALGLKVDRAGRRLVVVTAADDNHLADASPADVGRSGVFVYDLATGALQSAVWVDDGRTHLFNDLVEGADGAFYVTDSRDGRVYAYQPRLDRLQAITPPDTFLYPNGITVDPRDGALFVADLAGVSRLDSRTGAVSRLAEPAMVSAAGIDGLYLYRGRLLGVQNGFGVDRVVAFDLNPAHTRILGARVLMQDPPRMREATEGVVVGASLYFVVDSQQGAFGPDGQLQAAGLHPASVLRLSLSEGTRRTPLRRP